MRKPGKARFFHVRRTGQIAERCMSFWHELIVAFCLLLVLEGILPFLYPQRWRRLVEQLATVDDRTLRICGLISMLAGTLLLYLVR
ncbi:hypothetical protein GCM10023116_28530 [Kistimonas scapharcae]|uniref:DUF2065 domain-containing protein n=2 Tax=Endozoicomonadaceae TaxID=2066474 RepID=A0ABP8V677_9GAMM